MIVYKIRNKSNPEKFLSGTPSYNSWNKDGRIFHTLGKLRAFLTNVLKVSNNVSNWEVVEIELVEKSVKDIHEMIKPEQIIKLLTR